MSTGLTNTSDQSPSQRTEGDPFSTDHLHADLKGRSVRGGAVTVGVEAARFALKFVSVPILARLLTPEDFGLIAMVAAVTGFVVMFQDAGLSAATVQRAEVNHGQISTLFWVNVALSVALTCLTACLAPAIAWFYGEPRLIWITLALAGTFLFGGLTVQHRALLRRQMRFGALGGIRIAARIVSIIVGITAAILGAGYWALVAMTATSAAITAPLVWLATGWRPGLPVRGSGVRPMLAFGGNLTGSQILDWFRGSLDKVLIGSGSGASPLGIYTKAYSLLVLPLRQVYSPVNAVALPVFSRLQHEPAHFRRYYRKGVELVLALTVPMMVFALVAVNEIVLTLLGDQWVQSIPIFRALIPAALMRTLNGASGWLFLSLGRTDRQLKANLWITTAVVSGFLIGLAWGPIGVAIGYSVAHCVVRLPLIMYALKGSPVRLADLGSAIWRPAVASAAAGALLFMAKSFCVPLGISALGLAVDTASFVSFYLLAWLLLPGGREFLGQAMRLRKELRKGTSSIERTVASE